MTQPLFIFEMANNHMGDTAHGVAIIRAMRDACAGFPFEFAFKLQYRDLDTFIHPSFKGRNDVKYVKRFEETRLAREQFQTLLDAMRECGFKTVCTPFDEASVDLIDAQGIEIIKIASCSLTDWPLLERIARSNKPVIASTAGATPEEIDTVVSFFLHRGRPLTLMHCVAEYPTPLENLHIARVEALRRRYPEVRIGFSTHESPGHHEPVMLALAKGATVFERHVGLPSPTVTLNAYSANPQQVRSWLEAAWRALRLCGSEAWPEATADEAASLASLRRGVFLTRDVAASEVVDESAVCFAFPPVAGQITANQWSKYSRHVARQPLLAGTPLLAETVDIHHERERVLAAVTAVRQLLQEGNIVVPGKSDLEISHHYGMEQFAQFGLVMITVINREYCKKLIAMLPGQTHPEQFHRKKEETFVILHGRMTLWLDGEERQAQRGDVITVQRGVKHKFFSDTGVVFEEISSTHFADDSNYSDPAITANPRRKTLLTYWL
ncbi:cupin domain-containing protein [Rhodocyclus tenuis]|uniref:N-acetylneuraminate synthase family protein n=1 Tax=Rhodocyclus gracilis TaxID=2929842 RepID=UPI001298B14B|nr:N-acetylneuraminate synthase family protein [Rhodocyclus gracilis]MRD73042.1 cupin domain-containing protein [Rhodocyclus gracilis]